jgi:tetratricopeptide (TPR) repeat protein
LARGDAMSAEAAYRDARVACDDRRDSLDALEAGLGLASTALARGALHEAGARLDEVLAAAKAGGHGRQEVAAINGKAALEAQKRNFAGSAILYLRAVHRADAVGDVPGEAEGLMGAASMARRQGAFHEALDQFREAMEAFDRLGDRIGAARARIGAGEAHRQKEEVDAAETLFRDAMGACEELGAVGVAMEARLGLAAVHRIARRTDEARRLYDIVAGWADRHAVFEAGVVARLGLAQLALANEDLDAAYEPARAASVALKAVPGHVLWAPYRLVVAEQLARRGDMERTWQWLYGASELGLGDAVDIDVALLLTGLWERATAAGWTTIARHAHRLARAQWEGLGDPLRIREITQS